MDVAKAVRELKAGKVEYRVEKAGIVHVPIGKRSFGSEKLLDNANAVLSSSGARQAVGCQGNLPALDRRCDDDGPGREGGSLTTEWRHETSRAAAEERRTVKPQEKEGNRRGAPRAARTARSWRRSPSRVA